jgi:hypothetical protein
MAFLNPFRFSGTARYGSVVCKIRIGQVAQQIAKEAYIYGVLMVTVYSTLYAFSVDKSGPEYKGHSIPFSTSPASSHLTTRRRISIQRKTPGSFLPRVLLESCQTIGIRSYAERER